jgi:hypothetical protein
VHEQLLLTKPQLVLTPVPWMPMGGHALRALHQSALKREQLT